MPNRTTDSGVPRDPNADIVVFPTITDIGVPVAGLTHSPDDPIAPSDVRVGTDLQTEGVTQANIGVPDDNITGVTSE